jgi:hypothetical protein
MRRVLPEYGAMRFIKGGAVNPALQSVEGLVEG